MDQILDQTEKVLGGAERRGACQVQGYFGEGEQVWASGVFIFVALHADVAQAWPNTARTIDAISPPRQWLRDTTQ